MYDSHLGCCMIRGFRVIPPIGEPYTLSGVGEITIGRAPGNTLVLQDESVSRRHAVIRHRDAGWTIEDIDSQNGTELNFRRVQGEQELSTGDRIQVGQTRILCVGYESVSEAAVQPATPADPELQLDKEALAFPGRRMTITVSDPTPFAYGRTSVLFRAAADNGDPLCVKLFPSVQGEPLVNLKAFEREVEAQSRLDHPNILPVVDYGLHSKPHGNPFVIFPYCDGGSLRTLLRERAFYQVSAVLPLLEQIAAALDCAHDAGVIHGDVKPENVLLSVDRKRAYLSDFGMSNVFVIVEKFSTAPESSRGGGTTAFLSPEQISRNEQSPLSDVFAFAVATYELLTGHLPYDENLPTFQQMSEKVYGEALDPLRFNPQIGDAAKTALLAGLARDPLSRPRSASAFCKLLAREPAAGTVVARPVPSRLRNVFVSYSHADTEWLEQIRVHLRPLERQGLIELWDDTRIQPGMRWREVIERALESAACAVMLVSASFLASEFCTGEEVPRLLKRARERGVAILPVFISPCKFDSSPAVADFQAVNPPSRTLFEMEPGERERTFVKLAAAIEEALARGSP